MINKHPQPQYKIGVFGLGIMGTKGLLNTAGHGFPVAACDPKFLANQNALGAIRDGG